ncbi:MAG: PEP-CTERM sorting domain-containing protein [Fimbriimonadaceae bacterium]|nr:PEP-CTERM sorting domain-containing protein [Chthonomonadaceae bacterium]MCO5295742.1 PEP-CTERM sorting domain-containing protein [Fimbriimonadaceae bacterium]
MRHSSIGIGIGLMALVGIASAQTISDFTLTSGTASYSERNLQGPNNGTDLGLADFSIGGAPDNMFQNWWWYHTATTAREAGLGEQTFGVSNGNSARLVYVQNGGPNLPDTLQFDLEYTLTQLTSQSAAVQIVWKVHNLANVAQEMSFFSYADFDVAGSASGDTGTFTAPNQFTIDDSGYSASYIASSTGLVGAEQGAYASILGRLTDSDQDTLINGPGSFGPGDWTGGFQWDFTLAANGTPNGADQFVGTVVKVINTPVPEPASMIALALGASGILARRRKR